MLKDLSRHGGDVVLTAEVWLDLVLTGPVDHPAVLESPSSVCKSGALKNTQYVLN